jgi:DNA-binding NarL/FixJ family response regulator
MSRILLVDDQPLFRQALRAVINSAFPDLGICEAESLTGAAKLLASGNDITLILLDMKLPDCEGFVGLLHLQGAFPQVPVVIVSASGDAVTVSRAMAFGAAGFIPKSASAADIVKALESILSGEVWAPSSALDAPVPALVQSLASLSPAQLRILMGLQRGLRNKEIAFELGVTEKTVKAYATAMFRKLNVSSRTQALIIAQSLLSETEPAP